MEEGVATGGGEGEEGGAGDVTEDGTEGVVQLKVKETAPGKVMISVKDNGQGASENFLQKKSNSLGTKLIISFVKSLKGKIEVRSENGLEVIIHSEIIENGI